MTPRLECEYRQEWNAIGRGEHSRGHDKWLIVYAIFDGIRVELGREPLAQFPVKLATLGHEQ